MHQGPGQFASTLAIALFLTGMFVEFLPAPASAFGERTYDANTLVGGDPFFLAWSGESVAQSFTPSATYVLLNLTLRLRNLGNAGNTINITIQPDAAGVPSGTSLAWSNPQAATSVGPVSVPLTPTPTLTGGLVYWIVAAKTGALSQAYEVHHSGANAYAAGKAMTNLGFGWMNPATPTDLWFVAYGRELEANVTVALTVSPTRAQPKDFVTFTLFLNNTGTFPARMVWLNETLPAGLTYLADTSSIVPAVTGFPTYTFANLTNGPHVFSITVRVDADVAPGTVLTNSVALIFRNAAGALGPPDAASASVVVGLQAKQLYLFPTTPVATQGLVPPPPSGATPTVATATRGGASVDFQLMTPLARAFRAMNITATLWLDSAGHTVKNLDMNFTLLDVSLSGSTTLAYQQTRVTTDNVNGFQRFGFPFPSLDVTFPAPDWILLKVKAMGTSGDHALIAMNATAMPSRLDVLTPSYVQVDVLELGDANGPATLWSPKDLLRVTVTVSDPFGASEVAGAWLNLTDPSRSPVLSSAPMAAVASDPSPVPAWRRYSLSYGPTLANGTYDIEVVVEEGNGVRAYASGAALVRAPSLALTVVPTQASALSGDTFFYVVWYNNTGPGPAAQVWINATLPTQVVFVTSSAEANRTGPVRWTFAAVPPGSRFFLIEVQVRSGIPPVPAITATIGLNYSDEKGYLWPPRVASSGVVLDGPVLGLTVAPSTLTIHSRETFVFALGVRNTGALAGRVWLNVTLPGGLAYLSDTSASFGGLATPRPNGVDLVFTNMTPGASWTINVTLQGGPSLVRGTNLTATVGLDLTNARGAGMPSLAAAATVRVIAPAIVNPALTFGAPTAVPGDVVPAYVNFTNAGDEDALSLVVTLTLDPGLAFVDANVSASVSGNAILFSMSGVGITTVRIGLHLLVSRTTGDATALHVVGVLVATDRFGNALPVVPLPLPQLLIAAPVLTLTANPASPTVESGITFLTRIVPANAGSGLARDAWLNLTLPPVLVYVSDTSDGIRAIIGGRISWHWQDWPTGPRPFDLALTVNPSTPDGANATVLMSLAFADANGNRGTDASLVLRASFVAPAIQLALSVTQDRAPTGTTFSYRLVLHNTGTTMTRTLWLVDSLDVNLRMFSYQSSVPVVGSSELNWTYRTVQPQQVEEVRLDVQVDAGVAVGTQVPNMFAAVYTNSDGTVIGYVQSGTVVVTVIEAVSPLPFVFATVAAAGGVGGYLVYRRRRTRIVEVFLMSAQGGLLIDHLSRSLLQHKDPDIVSAMLSAVQDFVKDAFKLGEDRTLHQLEFGDYSIHLERGKYVFLAAVTAGGNGAATVKRLRDVVDEIESSHGETLRDWNGVTDALLGVNDIVRKRLLG